MNTEIEETKTKCGGRASGDVIAKSTKARTPRILSSKDANERLRLIFQAMINSVRPIREHKHFHTVMDDVRD
jgi:hypothetical protein